MVGLLVVNLVSRLAGGSSVPRHGNIVHTCMYAGNPGQVLAQLPQKRNFKRLVKSAASAASQQPKMTKINTHLQRTYVHTQQDKVE